MQSQCVAFVRKRPLDGRSSSGNRPPSPIGLAKRNAGNGHVLDLARGPVQPSDMQRVGLGVAHDPCCQAVDPCSGLAHRAVSLHVAEVTGHGGALGGIHAVERENSSARRQVVHRGCCHPKGVTLQGPADGDAAMLAFHSPHPVPCRHGGVAVLQRLKQSVDFPDMLHVGQVRPFQSECVEFGFPQGGGTTQERGRVHSSHPNVKRIKVRLGGPLGRQEARSGDPDQDAPGQRLRHQSASGPWLRFLTIVRMVATATVSPSWSSTSTR